MIIKITMTKFTTISLIRQLVSESIGASKSYMKSEKVREEIQNWIIESIKGGKISNDGELTNFFADVDMSVKALKMIPFDVFVRLTKTQK